MTSIFYKSIQHSIFDDFVSFVVVMPIIDPRETSPFALARLEMKLSGSAIDCRGESPLFLDEKRLKQNGVAKKESFKGLSLKSVRGVGFFSDLKINPL